VGAVPVLNEGNLEDGDGARDEVEALERLADFALGFDRGLLDDAHVQEAEALHHATEILRERLGDSKFDILSGEGKRIEGEMR